MDKKIKIRLIILSIAIVAAAAVVLLSTGLIAFWAGGGKYVTESESYKGVCYYLVMDDIALSVGESYSTDFGTLRFDGIKNTDGGAVAEITFENEFGYSDGKVLSAKPLFSSQKDYVLKVFAGETEFEYLDAVVENNTVTCRYVAYGVAAEDFSSVPFIFKDLVINDYKRK